LSVPERHRGLPIVSRRFIAAARALGVPVHVWTVNDAADAERLWRAGVSGVITDDPLGMQIDGRRSTVDGRRNLARVAAVVMPYPTRGS
jgi:glycerophosphoryl diester phosphodiesterase